MYEFKCSSCRIEAARDDEEESWEYVFHRMPPLEEARSLVHNFLAAVRRAPETFRGRVMEAIRLLERVLERIGVTLADLNLHRRQLFKEAHAALSSI